MIKQLIEHALREAGRELCAAAAHLRPRMYCVRCGVHHRGVCRELPPPPRWERRAGCPRCGLHYCKGQYCKPRPFAVESTCGTPVERPALQQRLNVEQQLLDAYRAGVRKIRDEMQLDQLDDQLLAPWRAVAEKETREL